MQKKIEKIQDFLQKEVKKRGFKNVVFGLSGGIDSAVVGQFCASVFKSKAKAIIMPAFTSNPKNTQDAINFARSVSLSYEVVDISQILRSFVENLDLYNAPNVRRIGNLTARIRMSVLYDKSIENNALVVGCSNKSELMLGYGTIFGDLACAINPIGDLFKSEIFTLAQNIGIPRHIIAKKPSADLFAGQSDEGDLGYSYAEIDKILRLIEKGAGAKDLIQAGFGKKFAESIAKKVKNNKFKSEMPKVLKL
ncbi:NAD+ synthase [Helicobacter sp. 23-1044]